jgi:hypothetical protein
MDNKHQQTIDQSDQPSFFGRLFGQPPFWRLWPQAGPRFWAGVLLGVGIGLMVAAMLVDLELLAPQRTVWVTILPGMFLIFLGRERLRAVVRSQGTGDLGQTGQS